MKEAELAHLLHLGQHVLAGNFAIQLERFLVFLAHGLDVSSIQSL